MFVANGSGCHVSVGPGTISHPLVRCLSLSEQLSGAIGTGRGLTVRTTIDWETIDLALVAVTIQGGSK